MWDRLSGLMTTAFLVTRPLLAAEATVPGNRAERVVEYAADADRREHGDLGLSVGERPRDRVEQHPGHRGIVGAE